MPGEARAPAALTLSCRLCPPSAGVGRTGVFITLSIVLERMRYEGVVDVFQTVKMLRTQRPAMVQTEVRRARGRRPGLTPLPVQPVFCCMTLACCGWVVFTSCFELEGGFVNS